MAEAAFPLGGRVAVPVPACPPAAHAGYSICTVCHGPARSGWRECWSCQVVAAQLSRPACPVIPLCLLTRGAAMQRALVVYKAAASPAARHSAADALASLLGEWFCHHARCLGDQSEPLALVPVPSSLGGRESWRGRHPLEACCAEAARRSGVEHLSSRPSLALSRRPPGRLRAERDGYVVTVPLRELAGMRLVVVDDLFVSGARAFSAAFALADAGARVAGIVPFGRLVRPDHNEASRQFWVAHGKMPASLRCCALCAPGLQRAAG